MMDFFDDDDDDNTDDDNDDNDDLCLTQEYDNIEQLYHGTLFNLPSKENFISQFVLTS